MLVLLLLLLLRRLCRRSCRRRGIVHHSVLREQVKRMPRSPFAVWVLGHRGQVLGLGGTRNNKVPGSRKTDCKNKSSASKKSGRAHGLKHAEEDSAKAERTKKTQPP